MQNIRTLIEMFRQLTDVLDKKQRGKGVLLLCLFLVSAVLETLGVGAVIPFIIALMSPESLMEYAVVKKLCLLLGVNSVNELLIVIAVGVIIVYVVKDGVILFANYLQLRFRNEMGRDLSTLMLKSYLNRDYMYFVETNSSDMINGIERDSSNVEVVIGAFSILFAETLTCILLGVFLIYLHPLLAAGVLVLALVTALIIILVFKKKIAECGKKCREALSKRYQYAYQPIAGYKEISVNQRKSYFIDKFEQEADKACSYNAQYMFICKTPGRVVETVFISGLVVLVCMITLLGDGSASDQFITVLGAVAVAAVRILPAISNIASNMNALAYNRLSLEEAYKNVSIARSREKRMHEDEQAQESRGTEYILGFQKRLEVQNVYWKYPEGEKYVLDDVSMTINKGDAVAFVGESGAGKTTLADVILGLLHPQNGTVLVDGIDIYTIPKRWARIIGFVPQNVFLTDDTVRNNVAFGIYEDDIDDDKVIRALKDAQIYSFVMDLPKGLDTVVGEGGVKLSGGQRQRLAIARALYDNPDILVLDEATSALDNETESAVMQSINNLKGKKTLIIIAHRLSTIENCNYVYEVKDGKVILT